MASTSSSASGLPSKTTMPLRAKSSSATTPAASGEKSKNNRYILTRNGVLLPWTQVHQRYKRVDDPSSSLDDTSTTTSCQNGSSNNNNPMDSSTLLQLLPRGAYTTCRSVRGGTHIYQFDYHVRRLAGSAQSILESITGEDGCKSTMTAGTTSSAAMSTTKQERRQSYHPQQHHRIPSKEEIYGLNIIDEAWEREMALNCIRSSLEEFRKRYQVLSKAGRDDGGVDKDVEYRIVLLATWEKKEEQPSSLASQSHRQAFQSVLYCHVGILPQSTNSIEQDKQKNIRVLIHGHGRENALAKDSKWVSDRKALTKPETAATSTAKAQVSNAKSDEKSYEEIILINDNRELLEGTQTNFYVVKGTSIITANEGILYGSVRDSVLRVCDAHNIKVELRPPTLDDLRHASGVFITSTSRLVMPVHEVVLGDLLEFGADGDTKANEDGKVGDGKATGWDELPESYHYTNCRTTENIRKWVLDDVETHSTSVYS